MFYNLNKICSLAKSSGSLIYKAKLMPTAVTKT